MALSGTLTDKFLLEKIKHGYVKICRVRKRRNIMRAVYSKEELIAEFNHRARIQKVYSLIMMFFVFLFFVYRYFFREEVKEDFGIEFPWMVCGFLGGIIIVFILTWFNWRCPLCHSYLGMKMAGLRCSHCGVSFEPGGEERSLNSSRKAQIPE